MTNPLPAVVVWHINILELVHDDPDDDHGDDARAHELVKSFRRKR